jgi:hypothetical protein
VFADAHAFAERLTPPARPELATLLGVDPSAHLVYLGQQACADMAGPTVAKFEAARDQVDPPAYVGVLWHDMVGCPAWTREGAPGAPATLSQLSLTGEASTTSDW